MEPLVSFVVPCYKLAHFLPDCVNSILAQAYQNFELLIMDNCSPDNTPEVAKSFHDPRVKHIRNDENIGHFRNFNKGISLSRGKYVWLVSADDFLRTSDVLGRFVEVMEQHHRVGYVFCRAVDWRGGEELGVERFDYGDRNRIWNRAAFLPQLLRCNCIAQSSGMVRRECFDQVGLFPLDLPHAGDWYLWCILALHYGVAYLADTMVCCRVHDESLTSLFNRSAEPVCLRDELTVLWRVCSQGERAGLPSLRRTCNASIARRIARALHSGPVGRDRPGLSQAAFDAILRQHARDARDQEDIRARVATCLGDTQFWNGEHARAAQSYWLALRLRPWRPKTWVKYALLCSGEAGTFVRRLWFGLRTAGAAPPWPRHESRIAEAKR